MRLTADRHTLLGLRVGDRVRVLKCADTSEHRGRRGTVVAEYLPGVGRAQVMLDEPVGVALHDPPEGVRPHRYGPWGDSVTACRVDAVERVP